MFKKILKIATYALAIAGIIALLGFAIDKNNNTICAEFKIAINYSGDNYFVDADDIRKTVYLALDTIEGRLVSEIGLQRIENVISDMVFIESVYAYRTIDGNVHVVAKPRRPIVRIVNAFNQSFYIDINGKLMPASNKYTARVPVAFGNIRGVYSPVTDLKLSNHDELTFNEKKLHEIYRMSSFIFNNSFWQAFIDQIYITNNNEFEIIPKGNIHKIEFGDINDMEAKFEKLRIFYNNGLTRVGWQNYKNINVKFNNQIVCSK